MDDPPKIEFVKEKLLVSDVFAHSAANLSPAIDSFASWILGGFGAGLALLLANLDKVQHFIDVSTIRRAGLLFLAAIVVGIVEKLLALVVTTASRNFAAGRTIGAKFEGIDIQAYFREAEKGFFIPARWLAARSFKKLLSGDLAAMPRAIIRLAQVQIWIALAEAALIVRAIYTIVHAL
jgi:hypothetical protein